MNFHYRQRVRCISPPDGNESCVGLTGTIYNFNCFFSGDGETVWPGVEFDQSVANGHYIEDDETGEIRGGNDNGWYCPPETLIPLEESIDINELI